MATNPKPAAALPLRLLMLLGVALGALLLVPTAWLLAHSFQAPDEIQKKELTNCLGMKLMRIPAGKFTMGSPKDEKDRSEDETQHEITISKPYYLGKYEVTRGQFRKFVEAEGYKTEAEQKKAENTWRKNKYFAQADVHPVVYVTWNDAKKFCAWLSAQEKKEYRLPTEAEWEYACRAGTTGRFHSGESEEGLKEVARFGKTIADGTDAVGKLAPNAWGLYDMHGNAWEWCDDPYGNDSGVNGTKPKGVGDGSLRVERGGSFAYEPRYCRSAHRSGYSPDDLDFDLGFRVALSSVR